jgi:hypothetical protein
MDITGISSLFDFGGKIIDKFIPDPAQAAAAKLELAKLDMQPLLGQLEINKIEAQHSNVFVSGWRPFIGWTCGVACAWNWIGISVVDVMLRLYGSTVHLQPANIEEMYPVLLGLLGLGAMRTYERVQGVHRIK